MKTLPLKNKARGLTLLEVLIVMAVLLLLAAIILPSLAKTKRRSSKIGCVNGLKQTGLAFRIWAQDNNDKFPMSVSVTNGGTMELVGSGTVWQHFFVMSNELNTPKILLCPNDVERQKNLAVIWGNSSTNPALVGFASDTNTSYFVGVDAENTNQTWFTNSTQFLAGDRNLTVTNVALKPGLHSLLNHDAVGWTRELHNNQGNVLMADGSVQQLGTLDFRKALEKTGVATNRLALP